MGKGVGEFTTKGWSPSHFFFYLNVYVVLWIVYIIACFLQFIIIYREDSRVRSGIDTEFVKLKSYETERQSDALTVQRAFANTRNVRKF